MTSHEPTIEDAAAARGRLESLLDRPPTLRELVKELATTEDFLIPMLRSHAAPLQRPSDSDNAGS